MSRSPMWTAAALGPLLAAMVVVGVVTHAATSSTSVATPPPAVYGLSIGATEQPAAEAMASAVAAHCRDASPARLGRRADATSSASGYGKKGHARRPRATAQVRVSCADARPPAIDGEPRRAVASGRLLLVFNRPDAPLSAVAFQRQHRDETAAVADLEATLEAFERAFGTAPEVVAGEHVDGLPALGARRYRWHAGCIDAELTGVNLGPGRFSISEHVGAVPGCRG